VPLSSIARCRPAMSCHRRTLQLSEAGYRHARAQRRIQIEAALALKTTRTGKRGFSRPVRTHDACLFANLVGADCLSLPKRAGS
jgi:hypothetical protein